MSFSDEKPLDSMLFIETKYIPTTILYSTIILIKLIRTTFQFALIIFNIKITVMKWRGLTIFFVTIKFQLRNNLF